MHSANLSRRGFLCATGAAALLATGTSAFAQSTDFSFIAPFSFSLAFGDVLYADAMGFYRDEGLNFKAEAGKGASFAAQMVIAKQMSAGRTGGTNFIQSRVDNGAPLLSIATIAQLSPFYIISSKENPVRSMEDLEGRTVGMASLGGSMEGTLDLLMRSGGHSPETVKRVKVADTGASYALIQAGRAGAFIGNTSSMITALAATGDAVAIPMDDGMPGQVYVAHDEDVAANPDKFVAFLRATHRAALTIAQTPKEELDPIIDRIATRFDVLGTADRGAAREDLYANAQNWIAKGSENVLRNVPEVWANAVSMLGEAGMIKKPVDPTSLYTNALLDRALA
ncbi:MULTISPECIES: ABC transporter substrate-binding protein [Haematobacter]|uniref:Thiamine pyrimidine synthase n=1 Tax=Haematobacter genomosp. 1 TaxID=366618 RepID=A0A212AAH2_9RHOB|nr:MULTISPECIES: ABC transporter substrate-binding protein [Haematobacter]OWJ77164.1 myristoyl transferase [Haematobacter genomosp. 1]